VFAQACREYWGVNADIAEGEALVITGGILALVTRCAFLWAYWKNASTKTYHVNVHGGGGFGDGVPNAQVQPVQIEMASATVVMPAPASSQVVTGSVVGVQQPVVVAGSAVSPMSSPASSAPVMGTDVSANHQQNSGVI